jgi:hypothetical protein
MSCFRPLTLVFLANMLGACSSDVPNTTIEETLKLAAPEAQTELVATLRQRHVPFRIDGDGFVVYQFVDRPSIEDVASKLREKYFPTQSVLFEIGSDAFHDEFTRMLVRARIPARAITRDGKRLIVVPIAHSDPAADLWRQAFELTHSPGAGESQH